MDKAQSHNNVFKTYCKYLLPTAHQQKNQFLDVFRMGKTIEGKNCKIFIKIINLDFN